MNEPPANDAPVSVEFRPPENVFGLLGNELRVAILRALAADMNEPQTFSELREAVGERDSGKFNYHLRKLDGVFVTKAGDEESEGYELTLAGQRLVGELVAGTFTADATLDPIEIDDPCSTCGETPLVVAYADDHATLTCPACEEWRNEFSFPPGTLDQYTPEELPAAFDRWMHTLFHQITSGFCANCAGRLQGAIEPDREPPAVTWTCERCSDEARASVTMPVLYHPAAQGFLYDHEVDLTATPSWRLPGMESITVDATDAGATVAITLDGDTLTAELDAEGRVTAIERSDR
ncbi:winged helix-turn-helix domain-containing protein [Halorarius litoreus]|uniref:winged helix-turn-helix domain-containing protein n=1 Tax=Halorarius litoreus TaxID=2962676 RepID=UPI0020CE94C2|nr:helix-turn-helix domain-containing protein [Halorarius litoreus]